jgi:hypothetical protein
MEVTAGLLRGGEPTCRLDHDIHAEISPRQRRRPVGDGPRLDPLLPHHKVLAVDRHVMRQTSEDGIVFEQVGQSPVVREVIHRDDLDVGGACRPLYVNRTEEVAADTPEAVHAYPDSHSDLLIVRWPGRRIG